MAKKEKVVVAMSGGVDSSVTAALLQEKGYEVVGVTMRLSAILRDAEGNCRSCCPVRAEQDARRVAEILGIEHYVVDFRELFRRHVIEPFLSEYAAGRTPNPCISCNRYLKFEALMQKARELGADYTATGHYARIGWNETAERYELRKGIDERKDQSYVLYHLTQEKLRHFLTPLGELQKKEVRILAEKYHLPVAHKSESQEICFVPNDDYGAFLRTHRPECLCPGNIVDEAGHVLGRHDGVPLYTIGQRRGLGIAASQPLYVKRLNMDKNEVVVGPSETIMGNGLIAHDLNWIAVEELTEPIRVRVKIRYSRNEGTAEVLPLADGMVEVRFDEPQRAITPGQSAVFYLDDVVVGGGVIERAC